jgi:hypothetical protein
VNICVLVSVLRVWRLFLTGVGGGVEIAVCSFGEVFFVKELCLLHFWVQALNYTPECRGFDFHVVKTCLINPEIM